MGYKQERLLFSQRRQNKQWSEGNWRMWQKNMWLKFEKYQPRHISSFLRSRVKANTSEMPFEWHIKQSSTVAVWVRHPRILFNRSREIFSSNFLLINLPCKDSFSEHSSSQHFQLIWVGEGSSGKSGGIQRFAVSLKKLMHKPRNSSSDSDSGFDLDSLRTELISHNFTYLKLHVWSTLLLWIAPVTNEKEISTFRG